MKILLIDDDPLTLYINKRILQSTNVFRVIDSVAGGKEAMQYLESVCNGISAPPDFIMVDLNMPVMDGFAFIEAFERLNFEHKDQVRITILTSSNHFFDRQRAAALGIEHYLIKPLTVETMESVLIATNKTQNK